jgi:hypothetical protein
MIEPYITQHPLNEDDRFTLSDEQEKELGSSQDILLENIQHEAAFEDRRMEVPGTSKIGPYKALEKKIGWNEPLKKGRDRKGDTAPGSKKEEVSPGQNERFKKADTYIEKTGIEIPGTSENGQHFAGLSPLIKGGPLPDRSGGPYQQKFSSVEKGENLAAKSISQPQGKESVINSMINTVYASKKFKGEVAVRKSPVNNSTAKRTEKPMADGLGQVESILKTPVNHKFSSVTQSEVTDSFKTIDTSPLNRIEQLRHALGELASKLSSQKAESNKKENPQQSEQKSAPPAQQVVIVKGSQNRTKRPCAFWERSYLGRFHLRTLR